MDIIIERLSPSDTGKFTELIQVFEDVFERKNFQMPDETYLEQVLNKEDFFVFIASKDNTIVGGLTAYILHQYYSKSPLVYIYDLAVKTEYQWQGIGKKLIAANNTYCRDIGAEVVMLQAEEEDDYAIKFYHSTGATSQRVVHFEYPFTPINPSRE